MRDADIRQRGHSDHSIKSDEISSSSSSSSSRRDTPYCLQVSTLITIVVSVLTTLCVVGLLYVSPCQLADANIHHIQTKYDALLIGYVRLQDQLTKAQSQSGAQASTTTSECPICPVCSETSNAVSAVDTAAAAANVKAAMSKGSGVSFNSLGENVMELSSHINLADHEREWKYCTKDSADHSRLLLFCPNNPKNEQMYQLSFYDKVDRKTGGVMPFRRPTYTECVQLPPTGYKFPSKLLSLPSKEPGVWWPNLRVKTLQDLRVFNDVSHKNLYHFDAPKYDVEFQSHMEFGARFIPLGPKIRLALDVGSGGGSFGLWLRYKYNIQSLSIAFPDWPYCEYISERGNLCMYLDGYHAFPFAKFTFDLVHVSWIYHSVDPEQLETTFLELIRITRPGGYLWMSDGWSKAQVAVIDRVIDIFGLVILYDHRDYHPGETSFGKNKYEVQLWQILLKPISATEAEDCGKPNRHFTPQPRPIASIYPPEDKGIFHTTSKPKQ